MTYDLKYSEHVKCFTNDSGNMCGAGWFLEKESFKI